MTAQLSRLQDRVEQIERRWGISIPFDEELNAWLIDDGEGVKFSFRLMDTDPQKFVYFASLTPGKAGSTVAQWIQSIEGLIHAHTDSPYTLHPLVLEFSFPADEVIDDSSTQILENILVNFTSLLKKIQEQGQS
jgi:hypothetical protein